MLAAVGTEVASSCVGAEAMPVSTTLDVTLSAVAAGAGGSTSTVAGGTEMGSTLGATVLVVGAGVDVVGAGGGEAIEIATAEVAPGFMTATCPAASPFGTVKLITDIDMRKFFI